MTAPTTMTGAGPMHIAARMRKRASQQPMTVQGVNGPTARIPSPKQAPDGGFELQQPEPVLRSPAAPAAPRSSHPLDAPRAARISSPPPVLRTATRAPSGSVPPIGLSRRPGAANWADQLNAQPGSAPPAGGATNWADQLRMGSRAEAVAPGAPPTVAPPADGQNLADLLGVGASRAEAVAPNAPPAAGPNLAGRLGVGSQPSILPPESPAMFADALGMMRESSPAAAAQGAPTIGAPDSMVDPYGARVQNMDPQGPMAADGPMRGAPTIAPPQDPTVPAPAVPAAPPTAPPTVAPPTDPNSPIGAYDDPIWDMAQERLEANLADRGVDFGTIGGRSLVDFEGRRIAGQQDAAFRREMDRLGLEEAIRSGRVGEDQGWIQMILNGYGAGAGSALDAALLQGQSSGANADSLGSVAELFARYFGSRGNGQPLPPPTGP